MKISETELKNILTKHEIWLSTGGSQPTDLRSADLRSANLSSANLRSANLRFADLSFADLRSADLSSANLRFADLYSADLSFADLRSADLYSADLSSANLSSANLRSANLYSADLSGCKGLLTPDEWILANLEKTTKGYIAYKSFGQNFEPPNTWDIKAGTVISEVVNPLPTLDCACGVNVSTKNWSGLPSSGVWQVLIKWEWLPSVVVPYNTNGKFRVGKCLLLEVI